MAFPSVPELLTTYPELLVLLAIVLRAARAWQSQLTWSEYRAVHRFKRGVFPLLDAFPATGRILLWVSDKGGREDGEFIQTVDAPYRGVVRACRKHGASLHLLNSLKRRPDVHGDPITIAHCVWTHDDDTQTECYLFANDDGTTDVFAHHEPSTDTPLRHLTGKQSNGDVRGVVSEVLEKEFAAIPNED